MKTARTFLIALMLLASVSALPALAGTEECFGRPATITGTEGEDELEGTSGSDVIVAKGGPDDIYGRGGNDFICAGAGEKEVPDEEMGGTYTVGDYVVGGAGDDRVDGGPDRDVLVGNDGDDELIGGEGSATLEGDDGSDLLTGGDEIDDFDADQGADIIEALGGADRIDSGRGHDTIDAGAGNDEITPVQGNDDIDGGADRDLVNLFWEACSDSCLSSHRRELIVDLAEGFALGMGDDTLSNIEDVWGGSGDDRIFGDDGPNLLGATDEEGEAPRDDNVLSGRGGDDTLLMSPGKDHAFGGEGIDTLTFAGNEGAVVIDLTLGEVEGDRKDHVSGVENARGTGGDDVFIGDDNANVFRGDYGDDYAEGGGGADVLHGNELKDVLRGNEGPDRLLGEVGRDSLFGGPDDDELDGGRGENSNDGGAGTDTCVRPSPAQGARDCEA